ncbi:hypothetical protein PM082_007027 [Marasmius tenuissimus]|nr:hypothetical protein PM082_007027 [Marasmius tenuissimus]
MSDSQSPPQSPSAQTLLAQASGVYIGSHATFNIIQGNQRTNQTFQQERDHFEPDEEVQEDDAFNPSTGLEAQEISERDLRTISQPYIHPSYYDVSRRSCSTVDGQPSSGTPEPSFVHTEGDGRIDSNHREEVTNLHVETRPIRWYIRSEEEEAEYDQYAEYKRHQRWDNGDQGRGEYSEDRQPRPADGTASIVALAMNTPAGMLMSEILSAGPEVREIRTTNALHVFGLDCLEINQMRFSSLSITYKDLQPVMNNAGFLYLVLVLYKYFRRTHDAIRA